MSSGMLRAHFRTDHLHARHSCVALRAASAPAVGVPQPPHGTLWLWSVPTRWPCCIGTLLLRFPASAPRQSAATCCWPFTKSALREGDGCKHFSHQGIVTGLSDHQALLGSWGLSGLYLFPSCHPSCVAGGMLTLSSPRALTFRRASSGHVNSRYERGTCSRTL